MSSSAFVSACLASLIVSACNCSESSAPPADASADVASDRMTAFDVTSDTAQQVDAAMDTAARDATVRDAITSDADRDATDTSREDSATEDTNRLEVSTADTCVRPNYSLAPYRTTCPPGGASCAEPYSCITLSRFVPEYRCLIPCRSDCECEASQNCSPIGDNTGTRYFCVTLE